MIFNKKFIISSLTLYILGILSGYYFNKINTIFLILSFVIILIIYIIFREKVIIVILICIFLTGFFYMYYFEYNYNSSQSINTFNGQVVEVVGKLKLNLESVEGNSILLEPIFVNNKEVKYGKIQLWKDDLKNNVGEGDLVIARIELNRPNNARNPGGFSYLTYLKNKKIYSVGSVYEIYKIQDHFSIYHPIISLKVKLLNLIDQSISPPVNTFVKALILGEKSNLDDNWSKYFRKAGANHLLAISGLHVGFLSLFIISLLNLFNFSVFIKNNILTIILLVYIVMTGLRASVLRASLLVIIYRYLKQFKINIDFYSILSIVLFIILIINPYQLFSIGLKLSFLVLLSIVVWTKIFNKYMHSSIAVSLAAQIGSIPLTAYYFNTVNPSGIITNLWAVPLVSIIVFFVLTHFLISLILPFITELTGSIIFLLSSVLKKGVTLMSTLPSAEILVIKPSLVNVFLYYIFVFLLGYYIQNNNFKKVNLFFIKIILIMILATILILYFINPADNDLLEIYCLDVGQGDSIFVDLPNDKNILVDTGSINSVQNIVVPFLLSKRIRYLDYLIISHFDSDHSSDINYLIKNNFVRNLIVSKKVDLDYMSKQEIIKKAKSKNINIYWADYEDKLNFDSSYIDFISPMADKNLESRNNNSIVFRLKYKEFEVLFTGDIEKKVENLLLNKISKNRLKSDILKVSHHGSRTSSTLSFIKKVNPVHALISVGVNKFGHPDQKVLDRFKQNKVNIWRTDKKGAVIIKTDGFNYSINSYLN
ncbi:MAG: DNA internalization-related competence protein ComEC/Rec2 [Bacillota bacterium]